MVEESPEAFISRWRQYAVEVEMFAHTEGSPLLECRVGGAVLQLFERTGPYLAHPGPNLVIVNPTIGSGGALEPLTDAGARPQLESSGLGKLTAVGRVLKVERGVAVVDAGVPLVVDLSGWPGPTAGVGSLEVDDLVRIVSDGPIHGFVVAGAAAAGSRGGDKSGDAIDDRI